MRFRAFAVTLCLIFAASKTCSADDSFNNRKAFAQQMSTEISHLGLHSVYVPDFCDGFLHPDGAGAYFATNFSKLIAGDAKEFTVADRVAAHRFLLKNGWTDCDLSRPEVLNKFSIALSTDSIFWGTISSDKKSYSIDFSLRAPSAKELFHSQYTEPHDFKVDAFMPPGASPSGWPFYFLMFDGVVPPKCLKCPNPPYPDPKRMNHVSGTVLLSALVNAEGTPEDVRVEKKLDPDLDILSLQTLKAWRLEPAKGPDGTPVPIRTIFQISFKLY